MAKEPSPYGHVLRVTEAAYRKLKSLQTKLQKSSKKRVTVSDALEAALEKA